MLLRYYSSAICVGRFIIKEQENHHEYLCAAQPIKIRGIPITKFGQAIRLFDNYNRNSPEAVFSDGLVYPAEYLCPEASRMGKKLEPNASEALLLASRFQHIGRWEIQRSVYPDGRLGYLKWRSDLSKFHADTASSLLRSVGYDEATIDEVREIVL